jgi:DNA-binding response OmpR family regulator
MSPSKRALHVDDDPMIVKLVRRVLERTGYQVSSARNGAEALRALVEATPSLILLDVNIGDENGYELCNLMREAGATAPIAFLTANRTMEDVKMAQEVGGDYFIVKPFTPEALLAGIEKAVSARLKAAKSA